jgi:ParB/RepB/Spo0J family partition protein
VAEPQVVAGVLRIPIADLVHGANARGELGDVAELAQSLRTFGQQQPLLVESFEGGRWSVFDGNRRLKAGRAANLTHMLAIPRNGTLTEQHRILRQLGMHATSKSFDPMAEAHAVEWLMFADDGPHMGRSEIAHALAKSESWVKGRVDLLQLEPDEQRSVANGTLTVSMATQMVIGRRNGLLGATPTKQPSSGKARCDQGGRCGCTCHKRNQTVSRSTA